jgi:DNA-binding transcriptional LysR family regulator
VKLDVGHLRWIVTVAETRSITLAAARLGVAQSAVSSRIQRVERHLGVRLFERSNRGVSLTRVGEEVVSASRLALVAVRAVEQTAARHGALPPWEFTLKSSSAVEGLVEHLREQFPNLRVNHEVHDSDHVLDALSRHEPGLHHVLAPPASAIPNSQASPVSRTEMVTATVVEEPCWVHLSEAHPLARRPAIALADLTDQVWLGPPDRTRRHDYLLAVCARAGFVPSIVHTGADRAAAVKLLAASTAITLDSPSSAPLPGVARIPLTDHVPLRLLLSWRPDSVPQRVARTALEWMRLSYRRTTPLRNPAYWERLVAEPELHQGLFADEPAGWPCG